MKKILLSTAIAVCTFFSTALPAYAANLPLLDSGFTIIPTECQIQPCGAAGALQVVQNIMNVMVSVAVLGITLFIVWAGFLFVMSATNPESRSKARGMLINAFIGLCITLSAWLIVDFIMKKLYNNGSSFGPWNKILQFSGPLNIEQKDPTLIKGLPGVVPIGVEVVTGVTGTEGGGGGGGGDNCPAADPGSMVAFPASVTSGATEKATYTTVQQFMAMRAAALKEGVDLKVTDGYRSEAEQIELWDRYNHDTSQVARPCTRNGNGSNHNRGVAIDISIPGCSKTGNCSSSKAYQWLKAHGGTYNFYNNLPGTDNIHWSPSGR